MNANKKLLTETVVVAALFSFSITTSPREDSYYFYSDKENTNQSQIPASRFSSIIIDDNNIKWFLTEVGIVSFDGDKWKLHNEDSNISTGNLTGFALEYNSEKPLIWIASQNGVTLASLTPDAMVRVTTYLPENSGLSSKNILSVTVGKNRICWFGTDKGISGIRNDKWLTPDYMVYYPENIFKDFPVTTMAVSLDGDSLYVGTAGAGVTRVFRNDVDCISGASSYAKWGAMIFPSNYVYNIFIAPDGSQWFGTDKGAAKHTGNEASINWTVYTTEDGLTDNFVQAIISDHQGRIWFGTKNGISVLQDTAWSTFKKEDGLVSNNILCLGLDKDGIIWIGTDNGVNCFKNNEFIRFK